LVEADNGVGVWTDSYDRQLTDVFAIQEEIARAIAGALQISLGLEQGKLLVSNRTGDLDSYQDYLRGLALRRAFSLDEAIKVLEGVVARDPNFAPAWVALGTSYNLIPARLVAAGGDEF